MELIEQGIAQGLIKFDEERKNITYIHQNKKRSYTNPEEKVQALAFLKLILVYNYPVEQIRQFVPVTMGSSIKEADIIVYQDKDYTQPYIVVECKQEEVTEQEFRQAVNQAFSYAHAIAGVVKYVWVTKGNKEEFYRFDKNKNKKFIEADIPYFGESSTKKYRFAKGGYYTETKKGTPTKIDTGEIAKVTESELTRIFKQAHDALWAGGELNPSQAFDELDKLIFCKVWDEKNTLRGHPYQFQIINEDEKEEEESLKALQLRILDLYEKGKDKDPEVFNKPLDLPAHKIKTIVEYFQGISFVKTDLDSKGKAFETFLGSYFRGEFGQFFTPRKIVQFMIDVLPITNNSWVLDSSCGSGGFLLHALDKIRKLATKLYPNYENDVEEYNDWKQYWHGFAEKRLFGIELNDQISRVAKMNMILHDDGHTNVVTHDALFQIEIIEAATKNQGFKRNKFNFVVMNPPFGSVIKQSEKAYMKNEIGVNPYYRFSAKELSWIDAHLKSNHLTTGRESQSSEVLFIEQAYYFLKPGGYLAIVVPDGILTNSSMQYVRDAMEEMFRIVAVVSMPQTAFTATGAGVKSSVLFLKKYSEAQTQKIQEAKQSLQTRLADQSALQDTVAQWEKEKRDALKKLDRNSPDFEEQKKAINEVYSEKVATLKEALEEQYQEEKRQLLTDYPIFMAIAEFIGYDATGKEIPQNDLPEITEELSRFIEAVEAGKDSFFG